MDFKDVAVQAARAAGEIHKKYFRKDTTFKTKENSYDLVTAADIEAEKQIVSRIKQYFPEHNFFAEEERYDKTASDYKWIIDPLDGTNNFTFGLANFCTSIALAKGSEVILGVVYDVMRDELFVAQKDGGAFLNDQKINVSTTKTLDQSLLITGFYYDRGREMEENLENIKKFFQCNIVGLRRLGAAALDLCYVACGRATGFWEFELSPWDFAAGMLLVQEAGGQVTERQGQKVPLKKSYVVSSNGKIHKAMLGVINNTS